MSQTGFLRNLDWRYREDGPKGGGRGRRSTDRQSRFERQADSSLAPAPGPLQPVAPGPHTLCSKVARGVSVSPNKGEHDMRPAVEQKMGIKIPKYMIMILGTPRTGGEVSLILSL